MAKAQKTIMIPEELYRMFAAQEKRTGVSFTRQALAAFCAYFFSSADGPDSVWLHAVVEYENGELPMPELPSRVAMGKADRARKIATQARKLVANSIYSAFDPDEMDQAAAQMEAEAFAWKRSQERSRDPIGVFIAQAVHHQTQLGVHLAPPPSGTAGPDDTQTPNE